MYMYVYVCKYVTDGSCLLNYSCEYYVCPLQLNIKYRKGINEIPTVPGTCMIVT